MAELSAAAPRPANLPETMSLERRKLFKILGAKLVLTEGPKGMRGAIAKLTINAQLAQRTTQLIDDRP